MNHVWHLDIDTACEWYEFLNRLQKDFERDLSREETEIAFLTFMKQKNIKSVGATELNQQEYLKEVLSKGKTVLKVDENGMNLIKPKDKE